MTENLSALPAGYRLHEYEFVSVLGVGGFGITYLARDVQLGLRVAIKEYLPNSLAVRINASTVVPKSKSDEESYQWGLDRFLKEAQTLARFRHPNIVRVLRFFEANDTGYTVMEFEEGRSLAEYLRSLPGPPGETFLLSIILPLLDGLKIVHEAGFLHRDIKPANIYMREDNSPILLDFGSARQALGEHTQNLTSIFSPGYAPFEQYFNEGKQGPWTDIYALGAILYRAITGNAPPDAAKRVKDDTLEPASVVGRDRYSAGFLYAIDQALKMNEHERPPDVEVWRAMLRPGSNPRHDKEQASPHSKPNRNVGSVSQPGISGASEKTLVNPKSFPAPHISNSTPQKKWLLRIGSLLVLLILAVAVLLYLKNAAIRHTSTPVAATGESKENQTTGVLTGEQELALVKKTEERFKRADLNGDGYLSREETAAEFPWVAKNFKRFDQDHDGRLSRREVVEAIVEARKKNLDHGQ